MKTCFNSYWILIWLLFPCIDYLKAVLSRESKTLSFNCLQSLIDVTWMFSLLSCVETFKEIEIFVEQYCINCKGIEKKYILAYFHGI